MPLGIEAVARAFAKRSRRGLFAGKQVLFGNKVSEDGGNRCGKRGACTFLQEEHE